MHVYKALNTLGDVLVFSLYLDSDVAIQVDMPITYGMA